MREGSLSLLLLASCGGASVPDASPHDAPPRAADAAPDMPADATVSTPDAGCVLVDGLLSWWAAEGDASDRGPAANHGILQAVGFGPGQVGEALVFDGSGFLTATTTSLPAGSADRTLEAWIRIDATPVEQSFFVGYGQFGSLTRTFHLGAVGTQIFVSQWGAALFSPEVSLLEWHHVAATASGSFVSLYVDGVLVESGIMTLNTTPATLFHAGRIPGSLGDTSQLHGAVDEAAVYGRALSAVEIADIITQGKCR